jgi:hypothetical protein
LYDTLAHRAGVHAHQGFNAMGVYGAQQFFFEAGRFVTRVEADQAYLPACNAVSLIELCHRQFGTRHC